MTNLLGLSGGASYRDTGSLIERIYDRTGVRLLSLLDFLNLFRFADQADSNVLNLVGLTNPIGSVTSIDDGIRLGISKQEVQDLPPVELGSHG